MTNTGLKFALEVRIKILQNQIDDAVKSSHRTNLIGVPMKTQIKEWKRLIRIAKRELRTL